jgi:hypothetical protein
MRRWLKRDPFPLRPGLRCAQLLLLAAVVREQIISPSGGKGGGSSWAHVPFKVCMRPSSSSKARLTFAITP